MNDELRTRTQELCTDLGALYFDLFSEIADINRLLEEGGSNDQIIESVGLIEKSATNILWPLNRMRKLAEQLRGELA